MNETIATQTLVSAQSGRTLDILFVCSDLLIGGTERQLAALASNLLMLGWRVAVYSLGGSGPMQGEFEKASVNVILPPANRPPPGSLRLRRVAALACAVPHLTWTMVRRRPAIVHFMLPEAYLVGAPLALLTRIPLRVMSRRSLNLYQTGAAVRGMERWLHRRMTAVLGNSQKVIGELKGEGVAERRLGLIYNGIDLRAYAPSQARAPQREALGLSRNTFAMCIVANLIPYKGHRDLIDALARAAARLPPDWRLLLIGRDDGIGPDLRAQAERAGIAGHLSFLGPRRDVPALLAASDVALLCSHQEGFANAILEAMASGLPVIATDVGGNGEAVVDGVTGLIVPPRDPARLADAILRLAHDPALRRALGEAGCRTVNERFAMDRCIAAHDRLYRSLLAGGGPADALGQQ